MTIHDDGPRHHVVTMTRRLASLPTEGDYHLTSELGHRERSQTSLVSGTTVSRTPGEQCTVQDT